MSVSQSESSIQQTDIYAYTLAEDLMPLIIARQTIAQAARRQPVMMPLNSPDWSMESEMSRALLNQKYEVGELAVHSFTRQQDKIC